MSKSLEGRVAIITGAGRGIGASIARLFAAEGAKLVVNDLGGSTDGVGADLGPAQAIAEEIKAAGGEAVADGGDVADTATGQRLVELAVQNYGKLDILVNVAGILRDRMIFNLPEEDWDAVIRVHLRGHFSTVKPAAAYWRSLKNPDGDFRIINFTSDSALQASPGQPNYAAAKLGIVGLTGSLANALARYGVTANNIAPAASTRLTDTVPEEKRLLDGGVAEPLLPSPDHIAPVVAYLAGADSGWLSGRTIGVEGTSVKLWNTPQVIADINTDTDSWVLDNLGTEFEKNFRPLADGLPPSLFTAQVP